jgi:hypothetical protein
MGRYSIIIHRQKRLLGKYQSLKPRIQSKKMIQARKFHPRLKRARKPLSPLLQQERPVPHLKHPEQPLQVLLLGDLHKLKIPPSPMVKVKLKQETGNEMGIMIVIGIGIISVLECLLLVEMGLEMETAIDILLERNHPDVR